MNTNRVKWIAVTCGCLIGASATAQDNSHSQPSDTQNSGRSAQTQQADTSIRRENGSNTDPGLTKAQAARASDRTRESSAAGTAVRTDGVRLTSLSSEQIKTMQSELKSAGYYTGEVNGVVGPQTRSALRQYFNAQAELASQGMLLPRGAAGVGLESAEIERVRGEDRPVTTTVPADRRAK